MFRLRLKRGVHARHGLTALRDLEWPLHIPEINGTTKQKSFDYLSLLT